MGGHVAPPPDWSDPRAAIVGLIAHGVLDAELAALLWVLLEGRTSIVVAGAAAGQRSGVLHALLDLLPTEVRDAIRVVDGLGDRPTVRTGGEPEILAVRAAASGHTLAATMTGARLEDVLDTLRGPAVGATDDEAAHVGVVVVLGRSATPERAAPEHAALERADAERVVAAHYLRPVARDAAGHVQRRPPAVLAARDAATGHLEHFAWGVIGDLAGALGRRPVELEAEVARRAAQLARLARDPGGAAGYTDARGP